MNRNEEIKNIRQKLNINRKEFSDALGFDSIQEKQLKLWEDGKENIPDNIYNKIISFPTEPPFKSPENYIFTQIDLFAGIGGIRLAFQNNGGKTVFSSEWDKFAQKTYQINFGETPSGDITKIDENKIPDHDILLGGFPCQPFSQAGLKKGFEDTRGTLFFDIARIIACKRPKAFLLENVKQLRGHDNGNTLKTIISVLEDLNYYVPTPQILNAKDFGVPQNRERIFIVGFNKDYLPDNYKDFSFPKGTKTTTCVGDILENNVLDKYTISDNLYNYLINRKVIQKNKGNGFGFTTFNKESTYTNTISARYYKDGSEALIEQENKNPRLLTPRECARLQGFPDSFKIVVSDTQAYRQFGNAVIVPLVSSIAEKIVDKII